jgi:pimeloyl-ACP methyl ester carboxylesterase
VNWLLLRGLSREQRHWGRFPERFEREVPGARVHCLDLPGTGTEHRRASPTTIAEIAEDLRARWLALRAGSEGSWGLLGMSLGGMVAMAWCAAHPEDFSRVVLASTSAGDLSGPLTRFDPRILPGAIRALVERDPARREARILSFTTRILPDRDEVAAEWARYQEDRPVARSNVLRQVRAGAAFRAPRRLEVPALILAGGRDSLAHPSCSRLLASHLGAPLAIHPDAGHELALDAPGWLTERIAAWLDAAGRVGLMSRRVPL